MTEQQERIDRLTRDLELAKGLVRNNTDWKPKERSIALFTFCYTKSPEDIIYAMSVMAGRYDSIIQELEKLIKNLKIKE